MQTYGKGRAWLDIHGVNVAHLRGTYREMAEQHGALLRDQVRGGALSYIAKYNQKQIERAPLFHDKPALTRIILAVVENLIQRPLLAQVPRRYLEEAAGLAATSGLAKGTLEKSIIQTDALNILGTMTYRDHLLARQFPLAVLGCTSAIALRDSTQNKRLLHARNMDYPVVGYWDSHPTVLYMDAEGIDKSQRCVALTSAGVHAPGITGINESGITIDAHFHCARGVDLFGMPIHCIATETLTRSRSLGEAIARVRNFDSAASWSLVISSAKENAAVVAEITNGETAIIEPDSDGILTHSNYYRSEIQKREIAISHTAAEDFISRRHRAREILHSKLGAISFESMAEVLGDRLDPHTRTLRGHGQTLAAVTTVTSIVTEMDARRFWIANRGESPVSLGSYVGLDFDENFESFSEKSAVQSNWNNKAAPLNLAIHKFRDAYMAYHCDFDFDACVASLKEAQKLMPTEGHFYLAEAYVELRLRHPDLAIFAAQQALAQKMSAHMIALTWFFMGMAYDAISQREAARNAYQKAIENADERDQRLVRTAKKGIQKGFRIEDINRTTFDFQFCDCLEFP